MRIRRPSTTVFDGMIEALAQASENDAIAQNRTRPDTKPLILALPDSPIGFHRVGSAAIDRTAPYHDAEAAVQPPCDPESIAAELGLNRNLTATDITALRRSFALRNHPDRVPEAWRALATERMTVANRLLDAAAAKLPRRD